MDKTDIIENLEFRNHCMKLVELFVITITVSFLLTSIGQEERITCLVFLFSGIVLSLFAVLLSAFVDLVHYKQGTVIVREKTEFGLQMLIFGEYILSIFSYLIGTSFLLVSFISANKLGNASHVDLWSINFLGVSLKIGIPLIIIAFIALSFLVVWKQLRRHS